MSGPTQTVHRTAQPLLPARPEQGRALLTVLVVMAVLAALALLFSRGADRLSERWTAQLSQSSTVQLLVTAEDQRNTQMQMALDILRRTVPDAELDPLSRQEADALLEPWLGSGTLPPDLPVPGIIRIDSEAQLPVESLTRQFEAANLRTEIDDHSRFSLQLQQTVGRLVLLGIVLLGLIGVAATAVSMFATRAGLAAQSDIIHVLVQAGASDGFIARLFVSQAARRGLIGAGIGNLIAALVWLFVSFGPGRGTVGWRGIGDGLIDSVALLILTALFAAICASAAGWAARRQLAFERRRA